MPRRGQYSRAADTGQGLYPTELRVGSLTGVRSQWFVRARSVGQFGDMYFCGLACTRMNCN